MRVGMQTKLGLAIVSAASIMLLSACLVNTNNKTQSYAITLPAKLPAYIGDDYISMQYESYLIGGLPQSPSTGITMSWQESVVPLPFSLGTRRALRFVFQDLSGSAVQYITQDTTGSIFLHAFEGTGSSIPGSQTHTFWPNKSTMLTTPTPPNPVQVFWSPVEAGLGIDRAVSGALDFNIMGECNATSCEQMGSMKAFQPSGTQTGVGFAVTDGIQMVTTPLGVFETYNVKYAGTLTVTIPPTYTANVAFDYRASCLRPGQNGTATFEGEMWIYPPIGPIKIRNFCIPSVGQQTSYVAQITGTNLPF